MVDEQVTIDLARFEPKEKGEKFIMVKYEIFYSFIFWISCINVRLKLFIAFYVIEL